MTTSELHESAAGSGDYSHHLTIGPHGGIDWVRRLGLETAGGRKSSDSEISATASNSGDEMALHRSTDCIVSKELAASSDSDLLRLVYNKIIIRVHRAANFYTHISQVRCHFSARYHHGHPRQGTKSFAFHRTRRRRKAEKSLTNISTNSSSNRCSNTSFTETPYRSIAIGSCSISSLVKKSLASLFLIRAGLPLVRRTKNRPRRSARPRKPGSSKA